MATVGILGCPSFLIVIARRSRHLSVTRTLGGGLRFGCNTTAVIPLTKRRRGTCVLHSDAHRTATVAREIANGKAEIHLGFSFPAFSTLATILYQNQKTSPLLSLSARHLCKPVAPSRRPSRSSHA